MYYGWVANGGPSTTKTSRKEGIIMLVFLFLCLAAVALYLSTASPKFNQLQENDYVFVTKFEYLWGMDTSIQLGTAEKKDTIIIIDTIREGVKPHVDNQANDQ